MFELSLHIISSSPTTVSENHKERSTNHNDSQSVDLSDFVSCHPAIPHYFEHSFGAYYFCMLNAQIIPNFDTRPSEALR